LPDLLKTLAELERRPWYAGQVVRVEPLSSRTAEYAEPDPPLPAALARYLAGAGIDRLYKHQAAMLALARSGANVIVTTSTASGKTLGFNLPVAESLDNDRNATALYLYPMKAVTQDQLRVLRGLEKLSGIPLSPAVYDGDTPADRRPGVRNRSRVVLSNPYELHQILPWHYQWQRFLRNLRWVVLDEAHRYRGVFGSNIAQLIRRLRRVCRVHGADPRFILSSASIANPVELAERLTGKPFELVAEDGSPHGRSWLVFYNPLAAPRTSPHSQVQYLLEHFTKAGFQTVCFVPSRRMAELVSRRVRAGSPDVAVAPYRAGYVPEDRRRIEADLSAGALRGVVSTEALELGIDVGGLDCIIIASYPGTLASFWQQAGRAGRKLQDSVIVFVGFAGGLDQYLMRHPEIILARGFESATVDLENPYILKGHLACAASELPLKKEEIEGSLQSPTPDVRSDGTTGRAKSEIDNQQSKMGLVRELEDERLLRPTPAGWVYIGRNRPQDRVKLEAIEERHVDVVCDGSVIETMEYTRALREAHTGAVLLHQGETFLVRSLDLEHLRATVERQSVDYLTSVVQHEDLRILETVSERAVAPGCTLALGRVRATYRYTGYKVTRFDQVLSTHGLDLPAVEFPTVGLWLKFAGPVADDLAARGRDFAGGMHGVEHALIALAPLVAMCDTADVGGASYPNFPDTGLPTIVVYDGYEGGIGISEKLFAEFDRLARITRNLVEECGCDEGCPACVLSARCGDGNLPMDKRGALELLRRIAPPA
jgi:DEAD/DEAH box helicase domain-containing protein